VGLSSRINPEHVLDSIVVDPYWLASYRAKKIHTPRLLCVPFPNMALPDRKALMTSTRAARAAGNSDASVAAIAKRLRR
jgi:hypothetical protein